MKKNTEYGFVALAKEEKLIMKSINEYLERYNRMFSKNKNKDLLKAKLRFIYKHFYFNLNKEMGVYMELYLIKIMKGSINT